MKHIFTKNIIHVRFWVNDYGDILKERMSEKEESIHETLALEFDIKERDIVKIGEEYVYVYQVVPDIPNNALVYRTDLTEYVEDETSKTGAEKKSKEILEYLHNKKNNKWWKQFFR